MGAPLGNGNAFRVWQREHDEALTTLAGGSMSFSQIAKDINRQFGTSYTRNACIGRAHRLKIIKKKTVGEKVGPKKPKPWEAAGMSSRTYYRRKKIAEGGMPPEQFRPRSTASLAHLRCVEVDPLHIELVDLEFGRCRWPYGEGPFSFCGHPVAFGSYCGPHYALSVGSGTNSERMAHRVSRRQAA